MVVWDEMFVSERRRLCVGKDRIGKGGGLRSTALSRWRAVHIDKRLAVGNDPLDS